MSYISTGGGGGGGTVTSVTGATPIASSGGATPAISFDSTGIAATVGYATDTGSANAIAVTLPSWWPVAAATGMCVRFKAAASSTGATTINITPSGGSAYGAVAVVKRTTAGTAALGASGDIVIGGMYEVMFDGTSWVLETTSSTPYVGGALTANSIILGNSNNQMTTGGANTTMNTSGLFTKYNASTLAGVGMASIVGATIAKAETTTADANVLTVTPGSAPTTFRASVIISVSAATAGVIAWTLSWTDSNGNAQANIQMPLFQNGTAAPNITFTTSAAGNYHGTVVFDINNANANIVFKWVGGGTTTAKMTAILERLG